MMDSKRIVFIDYIRVVACFLVIIIHTCRLTFGMYLMHIFFLAVIPSRVIGGDIANPVIPVYLAIPVISIVTFICCAVATWLISKIPGSKWIVG